MLFIKVFAVHAWVLLLFQVSLYIGNKP